MAGAVVEEGFREGLWWAAAVAEQSLESAIACPPRTVSVANSMR